MLRTIALLALASGCATEPSADGEGPGGGGGKGDDPTTTSPTLAPSYALELVSTTTIQDDREAAPTELAMRARARMKVVSVAGGVAAIEVRLCDVTLPQVSGYQPELDAAFVAGLPVVKLAGTVADGRLVTAPAAIVLGARLGDVLDDALPDDETDTRVHDQDADGNAGVSIRIPGYGSIFSVLRVALALDVPLSDAATLSGTADIALDRAIFGDDIWFYDARSSLAETEAHVTVLATDNGVRLKAGPTGCNGVRAAFP